MPAAFMTPSQWFSPNKSDKLETTNKTVVAEKYHYILVKMQIDIDLIGQYTFMQQRYNITGSLVILVMASCEPTTRSLPGSDTGLD